MLILVNFIILIAIRVVLWANMIAIIVIWRKEILVLKINGYCNYVIFNKKEVFLIIILIEFC